MRAGIFTEGSTTTSESMESYSDYFEGSFLPVSTLADDLSDYCKTEIHIISDKYGYVKGSDSVNIKRPVDYERSTESFEESLLSQVGNLDVIVVLLTTDRFKQIVTPNWNEILRHSKTDSIWCLGTSRSALNSVDLESLESQHPVLVYQRRGVARVGTETREELMDYVRTR